MTRGGASSEARIQRWLQAFADCGRTDAGLTRLALSPEEEAAHELLARIARSLGLHARRDALGNTFIRLGDPRDDRPPLLTGSHLDTVPNAGSLDGVAGIVCALEALSSLRSTWETSRRPLEVVAFVAEESSRFGIATLGSGLVTGTLEGGTVSGARDRRGISVGEAFSALGRDPGTGQAWPSGAIAGFVEVHIEQGPVLENAGRSLAVVTGAAGHDRLRVAFRGEPAHSGSTPMSARHDALCAAADLVLAVERRGVAGQADGLVATVTTLQVDPNVMNVVPGSVELQIDLRGPDDEARRRARKGVEATARAIGRRRGVDLLMTEISHRDASSFDAELCRALEETAAQLGHAPLRMASAAGHDAVNVAQVAPSAMLFVPSHAGISHHPAEATPIASLVAAAQVLASTLATRASPARPSASPASRGARPSPASH